MNNNSGSGTPAQEPTTPPTFFIVRDFQPGQGYRVVFITPDQAKQLPTIPADALQIASAPAGSV